MPPTQAITNGFKQEMLKGSHNFTTTTGNSFKMALLLSTSNNDATTANYSSINNEHPNSGNYTTTGQALVIPASMPGLTSTTAFADFDDITWATSTITARGAMIYNTTSTNKTVCILDFGSDKVSSAGNFTVQFPAGDSTNAIIRIL